MNKAEFYFRNAYLVDQFVQIKIPKIHYNKRSQLNLVTLIVEQIDVK